MSFLIRSLVAFSVAVHAAFGCCAHHAHAAECSHDHAAIECCADEHDHICDCCPSESPEECEAACLSESGHSDSHPCGEATCSLIVAAAKSLAIKSKFSPCFGAPTLLPSATPGIVSFRSEFPVDIGTQCPFARLPLYLALRNLRV